MAEATILIVEYNPVWPVLFQEEKDRIQAAVGDRIAAIEHVGSTAVPGLGAKPIIDIMVGINSLEGAGECVDLLDGIGYQYFPEHEEEMPERRYFRKGPPEDRISHLHMVEVGGEFWIRHLLFRNFLRKHPEVADEYYRLKKELASRYAGERRAYTDAKTPFIESVVARAREKQADYL
ncbi:MAG: GrpB family protein [Dehalococcoidales bacterium]|nr:MAG: GrpB family protein [Dehalococcoidales bacterium]